MDGSEASTISELGYALKLHEQRSQERYEQLMETCRAKGEVPKMGMDNISDKVNINVGDGGSGGGAGLAAVIAALGNRNEGGDTAGLIAALGNRNDGMGSMAAMMPALMAGGGGGFGGMNGILGIAALGLIFGRGRGGLFGGDGEGGGGGAETRLQSNADTLAILNAVGQSKDATTSGFANTALGLSQGFANVRDSIQASTFLLNKELCDVNQNVSSQGCQTREAVQNDGDKTRALLVARFQQEDATRIAEQNARIVALETRCDNDRRHHESNLVITNTNTAVAQQQQQQLQRVEDDRHHSLLAAILAIGNSLQVQRNRSDQDIINLGTMLASGVQTPTTTQVNR